jgi:anti-sigma regulatory factor (Ser/Thr protein kinase)
MADMAHAGRLSSSPVAGGGVTRRFPAHPSALHAIREFICDQAVEAAIPTEDAIDLALAVSEAGTISVCQTDSSTIDVSWSADIRRIEILLEDDGVYQPNASLRRPDTMGTALIESLVDEFEFREGSELSPGNRARLVKVRRRGR